MNRHDVSTTQDIGDFIVERIKTNVKKHNNAIFFFSFETLFVRSRGTAQMFFVHPCLLVPLVRSDDVHGLAPQSEAGHGRRRAIEQDSCTKVQ